MAPNHRMPFLIHIRKGMDLCVESNPHLRHDLIPEGNHL